MSGINDLIDALNDGMKNAQKASELERVLEMDVGHTQESTRDLIRSAIVNDNIPIGSNRNGYFLIDNEPEFSDVIKGLQRRIDGLQNGWQKRHESRETGKNWPKSS